MQGLERGTKCHVPRDKRSQAERKKKGLRTQTELDPITTQTEVNGFGF